ncbi:MFS transporter [Glutamicibacter creatinolyticus]|uniref:MFS transporter n=1 Tax=Glutamicibacter creatinolyticus TaxID=162496 RepID=UPI0037C19FD9
MTSTPAPAAGTTAGEPLPPSPDPGARPGTVRAPENAAPVLPPLRRQGPYRHWWAADTSALLAGSVYQFVIPLLLLAVTGSPAQAGLLAALGMAARVGLTLWGGSLADRMNRATLIVLGGLTGAGLTAALGLLAAGESLGVAALCLGHIVLELRGGLFGTATNAALKDVVHPLQLGRAMAANQGRDAALSLGGAPLGGLLLGLGAGPALGFVAVFQLLSAGFGRLIAPSVKAAEEHAAADPAQAPSTQGVLGGLRWCFARPQLRIMLWLIVAVNLGTNGSVTTLVYGLRDRGQSPVSIGLVSACMGVGLLLGSVFATWLIDRVPTGWLSCLSLSALGLFLALISAHAGLWWIGGMLAAAFVGVPALNAAVGGYFMAIAPRDMAGRANAVMLFMALLAMPLGPLLAGAGVQLAGMAPTIRFFAAIVLLAALGAWLSPHIRSIPGPEHWQHSGRDTAPTGASASAKAKRPASGGRPASAAGRGRGLDPHGQWIYL